MTRADHVAALYERGMVHHGTFQGLEDQMSTWIQEEDSPDRVDALVWAITELAFPKRAGKEEPDSLDHS